MEQDAVLAYIHACDVLSRTARAAARSIALFIRAYRRGYPRGLRTRQYIKLDEIRYGR